MCKSSGPGLPVRVAGDWSWDKEGQEAMLIRFRV